MLGGVMHPLIIIVLVAVAVAFIVLEARGFFLIVRDARRRSGRWGINRRAVACPRCHSRAPRFRLPTSFRQALWGGWTCKTCKSESRTRAVQRTRASRFARRQIERHRRLVVRL